tara:strand:- start:64 stop:459 length:396 start_codon:yes stop_codon:yes gene_type:complete
MTFYVSESLKGLVTANELTNDEIDNVNFKLYAKIITNKGTYYCKIVNLKNLLESGSSTITLELSTDLNNFNFCNLIKISSWQKFSIKAAKTKGGASNVIAKVSTKNIKLKEIHKSGLNYIFTIFIDKIISF